MIWLQHKFSCFNLMENIRKIVNYNRKWWKTQCNLILNFIYMCNTRPFGSKVVLSWECFALKFLIYFGVDYAKILIFFFEDRQQVSHQTGQLDFSPLKFSHLHKILLLHFKQTFRILTVLFVHRSLRYFKPHFSYKLML